MINGSGSACAGTSCFTPTQSDGIGTFYWTNEQSGRLMFYHDHAYGLTRLNVYAGSAAGYLLVDPTEEAKLQAATVPGTIITNSTTGAVLSADLTHMFPLVIQEKTFVPPTKQQLVEDPTWKTALYGVAGDFWYPHVYMTNQNPQDSLNSNAFGRWDYGPWFFPPQTSLSAANPTTAATVPCTSAAYPGVTAECPIIPNPSGTPEAFMDTPIVNGTAYPVLHVAPAAYRFRILNAANDRSWNLSLFVADATGKDIPMVSAVTPVTGSAAPLCAAATSVTTPALGVGLATGAIDWITGKPLNNTGLPANCWPTTWPTDGRLGGVPNPLFAGPAWIQIGTEGGLLPAPVVIPPTPVGYEYNRRSVTVLNVSSHGLLLGPAERADVIVDFSGFAGKTLIVYNDSPAPIPGIDPRLDYFTGDPDQTAGGGAPSTLPGYGPNTRTIMQIVVDASAPNTTPFNLTTLENSFKTTGGIFATTQDRLIVPESALSSVYGNLPDTMGKVQDNTTTFIPIGYATPVTYSLKQKAIQELFTLDYGRMNATLGTELPLTNFTTQTTIPLGYIDPPTEVIHNNETQVWKLTHNGVDTHFVHFHLFNVQILNRVGWDGTIRPTEENELGWKETVRMNPLEDIFFIMKPIKPRVPFPVPNSVRLMDVTQPAGSTMGFTGVDPYTNAPITVTNQLTNFGWEYVWHCHILGHEENDMMRPIVFDINGVNDIVWRNTSGTNAMWQMDSSTITGFDTFDSVTDLNWQIVGTGDFNGDGKADILWRNNAGIDAIWYMDGNNVIGWDVFDSMADPNWTIVGVADINGDGKSDIIWRDISTGQNAVWYMNGKTVIGFDLLDSVADTNWKIVGTGDFDNDGQRDIVWRNTSTGANALWLMNGKAVKQLINLPAESDLTWQIVGIGDFNNDVKPDILWRNTISGQNRIWFMDGSAKIGETFIDSAPTAWSIVGVMQ